MNDTLSLIPDALEAFSVGEISLEDLARAMRDASQEHEPTLPDRYLDVLERLLNQLESAALFSEESCSFSRADMVSALVEWLARAQDWSEKTVNPPAPQRD